MEYFVVLRDYGERGLEAVVDPALSRSDIVDRIKTREYDNIVQIDRIAFGLANDVTKELIDEAEAELADPFGGELALPASVLPPVR
jgi:hypothetical protein